MLIINSHKATGSNTTIVQSDVTFKRQNFNLVQTPPRQLSNQTYWIQSSTDFQLSASGTGPTEANFTFSGGALADFSDYSSCFDQYCIYSVTCIFSFMANAAQPIRLLTAIDYDSVANVGKLGIMEFGTYEFASLSNNGNTSLIRYIKPCIATSQNTSLAIPLPSGVSRAWIDCAYSSIAHYGLRTVVDQWIATANQVVELNFTYVLGFRNSF